MPRIQPSSPVLEFDWPAAHGLIAWTMPPSVAGVAGALASGTLYLCRIYVPNAATASKLSIGITAAGATLTANESFVGLYDAAGNLLGSSADQSTNFATIADLLTITLNPQSAGSLNLAGATFYYGALLCNGTTMPQLIRGPSLLANAINAGQAAPAFSAATYNAAQTSLPASLPTANWQLGSRQWWMALS